MIARSPAARAAASMILAVALLVGTAGCSYFTPMATLQRYDPSDGVGADLGSVQVRNALAITSEDGMSMSLLVTLVNSGDRSANVNIQFESDGERTTVAKPVGPNEAISFGNTEDEPQILISNPGVEAGGLIPVYMQYGDEEGQELLVPVLEATGPYVGLGPVAEGEQSN